MLVRTEQGADVNVLAGADDDRSEGADHERLKGGSEPRAFDGGGLGHTGGGQKKRQQQAEPVQQRQTGRALCCHPECSLLCTVGD